MFVRTAAVRLKEPFNRTVEYREEKCLGQAGVNKGHRAQGRKTRLCDNPGPCALRPVPLGYIVIRLTKIDLLNIKISGSYSPYQSVVERWNIEGRKVYYEIKREGNYRSDRDRSHYPNVPGLSLGFVG
jgi:hypothetical protein